MRYTITLGVITDKNIAKILAHKISSEQTEFSFSHVLESLQKENVIYCKTDCNLQLLHAKRDLKQLNVPFSVHETEIEDEEHYCTKEQIHYTKGKRSLPQKSLKKTTIQQSSERIPLPSLATKEQHNHPKWKIKPAIHILWGIGLLVLLFFIFIPREAKDILEITEYTVSGKTPTPSSHTVNTFSTLTQEAEAVLDAAEESCMKGAINMEKLYRIAISFNKQNLRAWHGLLNCYELRGNVEASRRIKKEIEEIFGSPSFSIKDIVEPYGSLEVFSVDGGVCRFTYTRKSTSTKPIREELFAIGKQLASVNQYERGVIFAQDSTGNGILASFSLNNYPQNFADFLKQIIITTVGEKFEES